nr:MAG TPA: hypothetical protein [Caudoviricetes sp.]
MKKYISWKSRGAVVSAHHRLKFYPIPLFGSYF